MLNVTALNAGITVEIQNNLSRLYRTSRRKNKQNPNPKHHYPAITNPNSRRRRRRRRPIINRHLIPRNQSTLPLPQLPIRVTIIQLQRLPIRLLPAQNRQPSLCTLDIQKLGVREAAQLTRAAVHGDPNVDDVGAVIEEVMEFLGGHLGWDFADVDGSGGRFGGSAELVVEGVGAGVLDEDWAAFIHCAVHLVDGAGGGVESVECYVAESVQALALVFRTGCLI